MRFSFVGHASWLIQTAGLNILVDPVWSKRVSPFAFAGLWERWKDPADGSTLESCAIVTTDASASIRKIHERMPVVLAEADWDRWLDTAYSDTGTLAELLHPFDPQSLEAWPVSREVNAPKNQSAQLIARDDRVTS